MFRCEKCLNEYTKQFESCPMCGGSLSFFEKPLDPVAARQLEEEELLQERREHSQTVVSEELRRITKEINSGKSIFVYKSFYMSVDSEMDAANQKVQLNPFDDSRVRQAGLFGWRIVGVVPKTSGSALQNYEGFGKAWAGGIGGNVIGAYIMMEYELNGENFDSSLEIVKETIKNAYGLW